MDNKTENVVRPARPAANNRRRRKVCIFCADKIEFIDYKDSAKYASGMGWYLFLNYVTEQGEVIPSNLLYNHNGTITADQFRFFKSQTLTISSTAGNITSIEFTCTAANDTKYGPGGFGDLEGYSYSGKVGTWTGNAASITFSTTNNQVRATQIVVTLASATAVEDVTVGATPVKVIENGQVLIIRGENIYNVLGAQVK